jgi:hypothetical protein
VAPLRMKFASSSPWSARPGATSRTTKGFMAAVAATERASSMLRARAATSSGWLRKRMSTIGRSAGSADRSLTAPRLLGATRPPQRAHVLGGGGNCAAMTSLA